MNRREFLKEMLGWSPYVLGTGLLGWFALNRYRGSRSSMEYAGRVISVAHSDAEKIDMLTIKTQGEGGNEYFIFAVPHDDWLNYGRPNVNDSIRVKTGGKAFSMSYKIRKETEGLLPGTYNLIPDSDISAKFGLGNVQGGLEATLNEKHLNKIIIPMAKELTRY